eukprot:GGOE01011927.1.p1 GENE.GGOE01011927.1~~GGOE01011927.1.p1  ORF type:complete len:233 (-),score=11.70 GGOE01011927.1:347-1045(-)
MLSNVHIHKGAKAALCKATEDGGGSSMNNLSNNGGSPPCKQGKSSTNIGGGVQAALPQEHSAIGGEKVQRPPHSGRQGPQELSNKNVQTKRLLLDDARTPGRGARQAKDKGGRNTGNVTENVEGADGAASSTRYHNTPHTTRTHNISAHIFFPQGAGRASATGQPGASVPPRFHAAGVGRRAVHFLLPASLPCPNANHLSHLLSPPPTVYSAHDWTQPLLPTTPTGDKPCKR